MTYTDILGLSGIRVNNTHEFRNNNYSFIARRVGTRAHQPTFYFFSIPNNSTLKINVSFGPITGGAPFSPYARLAGM